MNAIVNQTNEGAPFSGRARLMKRGQRIVEAPELGDVVIVHEAKLGAILPFLQESANNPTQFMRRLMVHCLEIDGERLSESDLDEMGMSAFQSLQALLPVIMELNGLDRAEGVAPKKD